MVDNNHLHTVPELSPSRIGVLKRISDHLLALDVGHPVRVAIDGINASGKTAFARELISAMWAKDREIILISMNGFQYPNARWPPRRHRSDSAIRFYEDTFDFVALTKNVLQPLGTGGTGKYRTAVVDPVTGTAVSTSFRTLPDTAIVLIDGYFLQRDIDGLWDEIIWLETNFAQARHNGLVRDATALAGREPAERKLAISYYDACRRYVHHPACRRYLAEVNPRAGATIVVDNNDPETPVLERIGRPALPPTQQQSDKGVP